MVYTPLYTSIEKVSAIIQVDLDDSSIPSATAVNTFIQESEGELVENVLGVSTATNHYIDVPPSVSNSDPYGWIYETSSGILRTQSVSSYIIVPLINAAYPIIAITTLHKNDNNISSAPTWVALTQWDGAIASDYMLLRSGHKGQGYALWIYNNMPEPGSKRLKATYTFGHDIDPNVLSLYCTYGVAVKVLMARMGSNEPDSMSSLEGGDLGRFVPRQYMERINFFRDEMKRIANEYFPKPVEFGAEVI